MINERMLKLIKYLEINNPSSINEVAKSQKISPRMVRYHVDKINEVLNFHKLPQIEKFAKGELKLPSTINYLVVSSFTNKSFSKTERLKVIQLMLAICPHKLRLNKLADLLCVTRRTLKNDLNELGTLLLQKKLNVVYQKVFKIDGTEMQTKKFFFDCMMDVVLVLKKAETQKLDNVEKILYQIVVEEFGETEVTNLFKWLDEYLEIEQKIVPDNLYKWYYVNLVYFFKDKKTKITEFQSFSEQIEILASKRILFGQLERIYGMKLSIEDIVKISEYLDGNLLVENNQTIDKNKITNSLVAKIIERIKNEFTNSNVDCNQLKENLRNIISESLRRVSSPTFEKIPIEDVLVPDDYYIYDAVKKEVEQIPELDLVLDNNDLLNISVHIITILRKSEGAKKKKVLLVCEYGQRIAELVKEKLEEEFLITVVWISTIQVYAFLATNQVDYIVSTNEIEIDTKLPFLKVHVIPSVDDIITLERTGLTRAIQ
ncbi:MAG: helix-turn-helix domain-containing protein [Mycoplasmatales bacterium]